MERLKMAVLYGADAVYLAGTDFGMRDIVQMLTESQKKVLTAMYGLDGEEPCERRDLEHRFKGELAYGTAFHHLVRAKQRIRYIISQNHRGALLNE
jgi:HPt (histidine-containing phosphotransfer) domain-containing protein